MFQSLVSIEFGHGEIKQDKIRSGFSSHVDCGSPITDLADNFVTGGFKQTN